MSGNAPQAGLTRIRLDIAYDGTGFAGWAAQAHGERTVQAEIERAITIAIGRAPGPAPRLVVAGRTDSGVHAVGQVAHVDLTDEQRGALGRSSHGHLGIAARRLTGILGAGDVVVRSVTVAPDGFDARFSAIWRRYRYRLADRIDARDPLDRFRTAVHPRELDVESMQAAATALVGLRDFAAFCKPRPEATTVRTLLDFAWVRDDRGVLIADVRADAFCRNMVRALVGGSIAVGSGRIDGTELAAITDAAVRSGRFAVAPAVGLTLVEVAYPPDEELAEQAVRARARRELSATLDLG
jgi:tRNA pseudouridine38-40 synthase